MTALRPDNEAIFHTARDISEPDRRREYVQEERGAPGVEWPHMPSQDFVEFELLRREAEKLISAKSKEKSDKK